ncbi:MAG: helix-turn-helix domain-containing protein [Ignavibacteria bacterium]|nr:helix-turn-helix domain-containing protein [Ignavibacteria bacterium]
MRNNELAAKLEKIEQMLASQGIVLMTFDDAVKYLKVSRSTLYKLVHFNKIKCSKPNGKRLWFSKTDLDSWALSKTSKTADEIEAEAIKMVNSK